MRTIPSWAGTALMAALLPATTGCGTSLALRNNAAGVLAGSAFEAAYSGERPREPIDGPHSFAVEGLYERLVTQGTVGLYLELPVMIMPDVQRTLPSPDMARSYSAWFVGSGAGLHFPGRLSLTVGGGGGRLSLREGRHLVSGVPNPMPRTVTSAAGYVRGGVEFHATERWGLRLNTRFLFGGDRLLPAGLTGDRRRDSFSGTIGLLARF